MKLQLMLAAGLVASAAVPAFAFESFISLPGPDREIHPGGVTNAMLATKAQTDGQIGLVLLELPVGSGPGPAIINNKATDIWFVVDGKVEFHLGDQVVEGGPGAILVADKGAPHGFITKEAGHVLTMFTPAGYEQFWVDWDKEQPQPGPDLAKIEQRYGVTRP